jgi:peptidoglycan DL-endopeptidase CwlO
VTAMQLDLTAHQYGNALGIIAAVKARGWTAKAAVIAVETALTESGMRMIASANVPESVRYPHVLLTWTPDGLGHDHASCGMFQQQTGYRWDPYNNGVYQPNPTMRQSTMSTPDGWGTPAELMNATISTGRFLDQLATVNWAGVSNWQAAQAVQCSAYDGVPRIANNYSSIVGENYRGSDPRAQTIVDALWDAAAPESTSTQLEDEMAPYFIRATDGAQQIWLIGAPGTDGPIEVSVGEAALQASLWGIPNRATRRYTTARCKALVAMLCRKGGTR